ncbi:MAG: tetratricopeptide repeat protein, partial [Myxococcaceae bacterium]
MSKPIVEKYEQILAQDPASTVFVELAKALIEKGEHARAIDVCKTGLGHHKESVVGRVLWGKALINLGKPAEAMEQFDQATTIDRDNPHAYNLIGEVLLHKGLYRSALPLLKKAVALQPNDGRVRQWLEQTQRALAGGPAPVLTEFTTVDPVDPSTVMTDPGLAARLPAVAEPGGEATDVNIQAYVPSPEGPPAADSPPTGAPAAAPPSAGADPFDAVAGPAPSMDTLRGLTDTFDALAEQSAPGRAGGETAPAAPPLAPDPFSQVPKRGDSELVGGLTATFDALAEERPGTEPTVIPSQELLLEVRRAPVPEARGGLLDDVASEQVEVPSGELAGARAAAPPPPLPDDSSSLLGDIPDAIEPNSSIEVPKVELSPAAAEAIAKEYERELRDKLAAAAAKKTFLQRHGLKLGICVVAGMAVVAGLAAFFYTRHKHRGQDIKTAIAEAKRAVSLDTRASYRAALEALKLASEMDESSKEAWALTGYADAILFADHGGASDDKLAARAALDRPGVRESAPGLSLICDYYLADAKAKE